MKTVAFVPIKLNNERLPGKNIKKFLNGNPLVSYILDTLKQIKDIDEIYVYCSDDIIKNYLPDGVFFLQRDKYYDLSTTSFNDVLRSFADLVGADTYVLCHATAPFVKKESIARAICKVNNEGYDSAFAVRDMQEFLWKNNKPYNYSLENIPRTQDLEKLYIETCGFYVYKRELIMKYNVRIGHRPYLVNVSKIESIDINTEDDFYLADAIYNYRLIIEEKNE